MANHSANGPRVDRHRVFATLHGLLQRASPSSHAAVPSPGQVGCWAWGMKQPRIPGSFEWAFFNSFLK